jgi:hypothetical protein
MSAGELTTGGFDPKRPDPTGENLTIDQIEERFDVSASTLRRKLRAGEVPGAHKVKTPAGEQWRLPVASVQQIWQERGTADVSPPDTRATGTADLLALADKLVRADRRSLWPVYRGAIRQQFHVPARSSGRWQ